MEDLAASILRVAQEEFTRAMLKLEEAHSGTNIPNYTTSYSGGLNIFRHHIGVQYVILH
jgi:hypothetical protein